MEAAAAAAATAAAAAADVAKQALRRVLLPDGQTVDLDSSSQKTEAVRYFIFNIVSFLYLFFFHYSSKFGPLLAHKTTAPQGDGGAGVWFAVCLRKDDEQIV